MLQPDDQLVADLAALPLSPVDFADIKRAVLAAGAGGGADAHLPARLALALATINLASARAAQARREAGR